ncbi:hypothetical protein LR48_Vigan07g117400 [Vigna angularis]|uniref:Uncharacterized protein n=1 Tax=Phaseolus angularis TaxID=3914 RepID=A0A0L9UXA7_PHAAN|nr:hypothetical protein LR48_Vigan07g117400 [Vigna angularis]
MVPVRHEEAQHYSVNRLTEAKETLSVELVKYCYGDRGIAGSSLIQVDTSLDGKDCTKYVMAIDLKEKLIMEECTIIGKEVKNWKPSLLGSMSFSRVEFAIRSNFPFRFAFLRVEILFLILDFADEIHGTVTIRELLIRGFMV